MRGFFIFEGTPSFLKKYQKGTPSLLIAVPQPQVILERHKNHSNGLNRFFLPLRSHIYCKATTREIEFSSEKLNSTSKE